MQVAGAGHRPQTPAGVFVPDRDLYLLHVRVGAERGDDHLPLEARAHLPRAGRVVGGAEDSVRAGVNRDGLEPGLEAREVERRAGVIDGRPRVRYLPEGELAGVPQVLHLFEHGGDEQLGVRHAAPAVAHGERVA